MKKKSLKQSLSNCTEPLKCKSLNNHKKPNPKTVKAKTSYSLGKNLPLKNSIKNTLKTLEILKKHLNHLESLINLK
jgi:hypothetical protein